MATEPSCRCCRSGRFWGGTLLLVAITGLIYGQTGGFEFSDFDDPHYVVENPMVNGGFSLQSALWALTTGYYDFWHPLTWWSHMLDCEWFSLNAGAHHLVNAVLHAANAALLFGLLASLTGKWGRSLLVAALFAVHPLHVESVAWVAERKDVLSTFFFLLALWAYASYAQRVTGDQPPPSFGTAGKWPACAALRRGKQVTRTEETAAVPGSSRVTCHVSRFYWLALVFFGLGLMAKAMVVTLPFVLLLLDFWPLGRVKSDTWHVTSDKNFVSQLSTLLREKWPFFLLAFLSCWVTYLTMKQSGGLTAGDAVPLGLRLANMPVSYASYLIKLFWPVNLAAFYPMPRQWEFWRLAASVLLLAALTWLAVKNRNRRPGWLFGWLFFAGTLVPVAGFLPNGFQALADRYTYIPAIGIFVGVVWVVGDVIRSRTGRVAASGLAAVAVGLLGWMAWRQAQVWRNPFTLWTHCLRVTPQNAVAENSLGYYYWSSGETNLALKHYAIAVRLQPDAFQANVNYGVALSQAGRFVEATNCYSHAVAALPQSPIARYDLGLALMELGDFAGAAEQCRKAADLEPLNPRGWFGLGRAQAGLNQHQEAVESFQRALQLGAQDAEIYFRLGKEWNALGRYDEAIASLSQAVAFRPRWAEAWLEMAVARINQHDEPQAASCCRQALDADPSCLPALNNLAWLLATSKHEELRDGGEAVRLSERACQLTAYQEPVFVGTLAAAYAEAGRFDEAVRTAGLACDLTRSTGQTNLFPRNQSLLAEYEKHVPHRE